MLGRSRGGLWASSWAIENPQLVAGIAGIYPVFDLRAYPGLDKAASAYKLKPAELEAELATHNPIAKADVLAKAKVPWFIIHGDEDVVVPLASNSAALQTIYQHNGAGEVFELEVVKGQGHNFWEGLPQPTSNRFRHPACDRRSKRTKREVSNPRWCPGFSAKHRKSNVSSCW